MDGARRDAPKRKHDLYKSSHHGVPHFEGGRVSVRPKRGHFPVAPCFALTIKRAKV